jgi:hypothetical protein
MVEKRHDSLRYCHDQITAGAIDGSFPPDSMANRQRGIRRL